MKQMTLTVILFLLTINLTNCSMFSENEDQEGFTCAHKLLAKIRTYWNWSENKKTSFIRNLKYAKHVASDISLLEVMPCITGYGKIGRAYGKSIKDTEQLNDFNFREQQLKSLYRRDIELTRITAQCIQKFLEAASTVSQLKRMRRSDLLLNANQYAESRTNELAQMIESFENNLPKIKAVKTSNGEKCTHISDIAYSVVKGFGNDKQVEDLDIKLNKKNK